MHMQLEQLQIKLKGACEQSAAAVLALSSAQNIIHRLQSSIHNNAAYTQHLLERVAVLEAQYHNSSQRLKQALEDLKTQEEMIRRLQRSKEAITRSQDALRKKISRASKRRDCEHKVAQKPLEFNIKDHTGTICPEARTMLRQLACENVATERMLSIINAVSDALGVTIVGTFSPRSVSRIVLEGLVEAQIQVAAEINQVDALSISGDGTSIKNQQYESKSISLPLHTTQQSAHIATPTNLDIPPVLRTLGVHKSPSHTAQAQLAGWISVIDSCFSLLAKSPSGQASSAGSTVFASKLRGVLSDHASDQKLLYKILTEWKQNCDRETRGTLALQTMSRDDQLQALSRQLEEAYEHIGAREALTLDQQSTLIHNAWLALALRIGETEFQKLTHEEKLDVDFVAWTGCCMHKELNAVKGGAAAMGAAWGKLGWKPPIPLQNKYERKESSGPGDEKAPRGGVKLTSLAGAVMNNKDDKKGYHESVNNFFEASSYQPNALGYSGTFPDTNNTRYGSHCDAATELLIHLDQYVELLEQLRNSKNLPAFTNIELNLYNGLKDVATLTELAVLALYAQAIGHPYMAYVRGTVQNALNLGSFHMKLKDHCQAIIDNPGLLLAHDATYATGALTGQPWDRPDLIYRVHSMAYRLPHLRDMVKAFFTGALESWERFTSEFAPGGTIDQATPEQRFSAWNSPTNDANEGALGRCRQMLRRAPTMTDNQRNARVMWQQNGTGEWAKRTLTDADLRFTRREARLIDSSGVTKRTRLEMNQAVEARAEIGRNKELKAEKKRAAKQERLASIELLINASREELCRLSVWQLDQQIDKLRETDKTIRARSTIGNKQAKIEEILHALERHSQRGYKAGVATWSDPGGVNMGDPVGEPVDDEISEDEEMRFDDED